MSFNRSGYIGRAPGDSAITIAKQYFQPTGVQTDFTFSSGYSPGLVDVYRNGVKLINVLDYAATDGSTISLDSPVGVGSTVQVVAYKAFNLATVKATELDTSVTGTDLTLGGDLTVSDLITTVDINVSGSATVSGTVVAGSFSGDGSALTGLATTEYVVSVATTTGNLNVSAAATITGDLTVSDSIAITKDINVGAAATITGALSGSTGTFSGAVNVDATTDSTSSTTGALIVDGGLGVAKNVYIGAGLSVAGTLTYEDVTNVDSVGMVTAKSGVNITGGQLTVGSGITMGIAGVATFSGTGDVHLLDNVRLNVGDGSDLAIYHDANNSYIQDSGTGVLRIASNQIQVTNAAASEVQANFIEDGAVELYYNNGKKFETTNDGTVTTGIGTFTTNVAIDAAFGEANTDANDLVIGSTSDTQKGISIVGSTSGGVGNIIFTDGAGYKNQGYIQYRHADDEMRIRAGGADVLRLTSTKVGVGTTNPQQTLHLESASNTYLQISKPDTASNILIGNANGDCIIESTGGAVKLKPNNASNKFILDTNGRLILGHSASTGLDRIFQVVGTTSDTSSIELIRHTADTAASKLDFSKSRNGTIGSNTVVQANDVLGDIIFRGDDGTDLNSEAVKISALVDGTPGSNDMPGRLVFSTSADGSNSPTERLRIDKTGSFIFSNGALTEKVNITAGRLSDNTNIDLADGMVHYFTTQETTTCTPNIRIDSSNSLNDAMDTADVVTVTLITTAAAAGYHTNITIDGNAVTEEWVGGSAPSEGGSDGLDVYTYTIIKTGNNAYTVLANLTNCSN